VVREVGYPDPETFRSSFELLSSWLESLPEALGFPSDRLVLGGFSQGCVMSYALTLGLESPVRAVALIALSGFIPRVEGFELDLAGRRLPVAIGHGTLDPIISVQFGREARDLLERAGFDVTYRESPMAHSVDPDFLTNLVPWLNTNLR
jgi:phospholipase/carboxylesterase